MSGLNKSSPLSAPKSSGSKSAPDAGQRSRGVLRLRAEDADDLRVISACLQDALVPVSDIAYLTDDQRFVLVANRFRHEADGGGARANQRVLCGLCFEGVRQVERKGFAAGTVDGFLNLLSIEFSPAAATAVVLRFSGGAAVRLTIDRLRVRLDEMGEPWPTQWAPAHDG